MKKIIVVTLTFFIAIIMTAGCSNEKKLVCHRTMSSDNDIVTATYNVWYKGDIVTKIKSVESLASTNKETLDDYQSKMTTLYSPYLGIDYYNYNIVREEKKVTVTLDVNYDKVNIEKLLAVDPNNDSFFHDGKVYLNTLLDLYDNVGVICNE